jgi:hypothetical protein
MFGVGTSMEESSCALVVGELYLFKRLSILASTCANPLSWWWCHETRFQMLAFYPSRSLEF